MNVAGATSAIMLDAANNLFNKTSLTIYSGTMPTTPETALSGNTALVSWTYPNTAYAATSWTVSASKVSNTSNTLTGGSPTASGTASFGRLTTWAWVTGTVVAANTYTVNASKLYFAATGGTTGATAPTHSTGSTSDGAVSWLYVGAANCGTTHVIADYTVGTSGTDITLGTTTISTGTTVTLNTITNTEAAV